ncbi:MAG: hypothetical protein JO208_11035, partial [Alphaproteobacteria bacterium]|nr:hypothetical protein [Alphaproteobacteria bacterium]
MRRNAFLVAGIAVAWIALILGMRGGALAAETPQPIRKFDLTTIQTLGRAMYEQDREAWRATDLLRAKVSDDQLKADKLHGWIVDTFADYHVVRFVHDTAGGPEAYYDVMFGKNGAQPTLAAPPNRVLTASEAAQYRARSLALANISRACTDSYNTIVLKDPERGGWLAWALAATTDPKLIMLGGHYRFTISADGKNVVQKDALSLTCRQYQRPPAGKAGFLLSNNVVSLMPLETHVFAGLSYGLTIYVGTPDGEVWKVAQGAIQSVAQDSPDP